MGKNQAITYYRKGNQFLKAGQLDLAAKWFKKSLKSNPKQFEPHHNLAIVYQHMGKFDQSERLYKKSLLLSPKEKRCQVYFNYGNLYFHHALYDEAIDCYRKSTELEPGLFRAWMNLGISLVRVGLLHEATPIFQKAIEAELVPEAVNALGMSLSMQKQVGAAQVVYSRGLRDFPTNSSIAANLLATSMMLCDWDMVDTVKPILEKMTKRELAFDEKPGETPFILTTRMSDPVVNLKLAQAYTKHMYHSPTTPIQVRSNNRSVERKLKIGYLSYDFRDHVMGYHLLSLFKRYNRDRFGTYAYSYGPAEQNHYRDHYEEQADRFVDIQTMGDQDAAQQIADDEIDILVDLAGYTENNRVGILTYRPAPITVSLMGFPGTMGSSYVDYIIADKVLIPDSDFKHYSEAVVQLPYGYQLTSYEDLKIPRTPSRAAAGLPKEAFVMAAFNRGYKIKREMFAVWLRLLQAIPESVLWLPTDFPPVQENLSAIAQRSGVDPERLLFAKQVSYEEHLARLSLADLALDTSVYNGGSTTANMLYAEVPVVTLRGTHYASRMSMAMLAQIGLETLIVDDLAAYEKKVVELAQHPNKLITVRQHLKKGVVSSKIFDATAKVDALESAYRMMWERYITDALPANITIVARD